ncbi:hypothetical protein HRI_005230200 [Hibiscus trionum]|uniref:Uncharacterized protein n=1 Tax=Hibiscus trionum TaxID=183268 RepID=A0A9W7MWW1_HIBTR|nr:hypothetical protein HRI_005230200 [Hibiscus trionum]
MEKSKKLPLGVQKKSKSTKKKKVVFSNVINYLKSDCYMFAPLISPSLSGLKWKENKKMRVLKMVAKYMKSDTYMYSPLLSSQLMASPPSEQIQSRSRTVAVEGVMRMLTTESVNATAEQQPSSRPGLSIGDDQTRGHGETVKHMVYHQRRCSTRVSAGKAMADMQLRKLVVE